MLSYYQHVEHRQMLSLNKNTCDHFRCIYITKVKPGWYLLLLCHRMDNFNIGILCAKKIGLFLRITFLSFDNWKCQFLWLVVKTKVTKSYLFRLKMLSSRHFIWICVIAITSQTNYCFVAWNYFEFPRWVEIKAITNLSHFKAEFRCVFTNFALHI